MRVKSLKNFAVILSVLAVGFQSLASDSLFSCAPQGGQLNSDDTYVTYTLDKNGSDNDLTMALRKTIVGPGDESTLEKTAYSLAFIYSERDMGFEFGYMAGEDLFLMSGEFFSQPRTPQVIAKAIILLEFNNTAKLFQGLMEPPADIESWQCLVNIEEMRKFTYVDKGDVMTFNKLKSHFLNRSLNHSAIREIIKGSKVFSQAVELKKAR